MSDTTASRLKARLLKKDKHLGRCGDEMKRLADLSTLSVHTLQSVAMGRKQLSEDSRHKVREALAGRQV